MKLKYIILSFIAALAGFTSCSDDNDPTYLDEVRLSSSYVALPQNGGSQTIDITAKDSWTIDASTVPEWLTISPASGNAGQGNITFTVAGTDAARNCELLLQCAGKTQRINVMQYAEEKDPVIMSVAEAVALIKSGKAPGSAVYVKGVVCRIQEISPSYGNATYYLSDDGTFGDGNWLQVYRGKWINGANYTTGDEFGVGDEMVIKGVLIDYNGTPETQQGACEVISVVKSLIKCDSTYVAGELSNELPIEGGELTAYITCSGNGVEVEIPDNAKDWLSVTAVKPNTITFYARPNTGGDRSTTVTFKTNDGTKDYTAETTIVQKGAIVAATMAEFLAAEVGDTQYRLTGVITKVANKTYGNVYIADYSGEAYVYGIGAKGDFEKLGLKEGDVVTLVGKRAAHNGNAQVGGAQYESHISVTDVTIAEFLTKEDDSKVYYRVTGTVDEIANTTYGNLYLKDGDSRVYVYGCYPGWGATGDFRKNCIADKDIAVGDKLTVIGVKGTHNGTTQVANGIYFSHVKAN